MTDQLSDFVHRFVPATKRGFPMLLLLHGTGGNESDLIELGHDLLPGAALLSPRGKVSENGMPRFFKRLSEGVFDIDDLKHRAKELGDLVDSACRQYHIESSPLIAVGYSNGANIGSALMFARPDLLAGGCLFRPMVPYQPDPLPDLSGRQVLLLAGTHDPTMSSGQPDELASLFEQCHATVLLHKSNAGHELTSVDIRIAQAWLANFGVAS